MRMHSSFATHHGIVDWIPPASTYVLPLNETTIADKLKEAGYATHAGAGLQILRQPGVLQVLSDFFPAADPRPRFLFRNLHDA